MYFDSHKDFAYSTIPVGGAPSPATTGNSLKVQTGDGALFPTPPFRATAWPPGVTPLSSNAEIIQINGNAGNSDSFVITRAQEDSSAKSIVAGWQIAATITRKPFEDLEAALGQHAIITVGSVAGADYQTDGRNDTAQIQAAINAANSGVPTIVELISAAFTLTGALSIKSNVWLRARQRGTTITLANGANSSMIVAAAGGLTNVTISDIIFDGNAANQTSGNTGIILLDGGDILLRDIVIDGCTVKNSYRHGIVITGDNTSNRFKKTVKNCYVENHGPSAVGFGIYVDYAPNTTIQNCTIKTSNGNDAIEMGHLGEIYVLNNYIYDGPIQFPFASNSIIANNIVRANTIQNDANTANNMIIVGNQVLNASPTTGYAGISVVGANAVVQNNYVKVSTNAGIRVYSSDYSTISGNIIDGTSPFTGGNNGVYVENSNYVTVSNNQIANFIRGVELVLDYNTIVGNTVKNCTVGIDFVAFSGSAHTMVDNMVINNNLAGATTKIALNNQNSNYIIKNNYGANPEKFYAQGSLNGVITFDRSNGDVISGTLAGAITPTFTNGVAKGDRLTLILTQPTIGTCWGWTLPSNVKVAYGSLDLSRSNSAVDTITFVWDGSNWREQSRAISDSLNTYSFSTSTSSTSTSSTSTSSTSSSTSISSSTSSTSTSSTSTSHSTSSTSTSHSTSSTSTSTTVISFA